MASGGSDTPVPPPLSRAELARRATRLLHRDGAPDAGPHAHRWQRGRLAGWRRAMAADLVAVVAMFLAFAFSHDPVDQGPSAVTVALVAAGLGVAAVFGMRRAGGGALAGGACFGCGMLAFVIWRLLATALWGGNFDLALSLGPRLALRLAAAVVLGCLWGYWRSLRRDRG